MTAYIQDGDGRLYEVVEGSLDQDEQYVLGWQDIADKIDAQEAKGITRAEALTAALLAEGRKAVFVQRVPNTVDPAPSDGVHRVYAWNTDGSTHRPGFLVRALERPSKSFFERRLVEAQAAEAQSETRRAEAAAALERIDASLEAATTLREYRTAVEGGALEEKTRLQIVVDTNTVVRDQAAAGVAEATDAIAVVEQIGPGHSVEVVTAKIAETRARRM